MNNSNRYVTGDGDSTKMISRLNGGERRGGGRGRRGAVKDGWHLPAPTSRSTDSLMASNGGGCVNVGSGFGPDSCSTFSGGPNLGLGGGMEYSTTMAESRDPNPTATSSSSSFLGLEESISKPTSPFSLSVSRVQSSNNNSLFQSPPSASATPGRDGDVAAIYESGELGEVENEDHNNILREYEDDDDVGEVEEHEEVAVEDDLAVAMRLQREEEESIRLAQQLMAEEAMASYQHMARDYLRNNEGNFSEADLAALQAAMEGNEDQMPTGYGSGGRDNRDEDVTDGDDDGMTYELLMRLGENLGDVKTERWAQVASEKINALPLVQFDPQRRADKDTNGCDTKCLICQYDYEKDESLRRLPCKHHFHQECVDEWLQRHDSCPYCSHGIDPH
jgi:E3 ubiquitin-protein ligase BIG BROTHER-like protein